MTKLLGKLLAKIITAFDFRNKTKKFLFKLMLTKFNHTIDKCNLVSALLFYYKAFSVLNINRFLVLIIINAK